MCKKLSLSAFIIDGDKFSELGFTDGETWNGWARPRFLKSQIESYLKNNGWDYKFDGEILTIKFEGNDPESFTYKPQLFDTFRLGKVPLYEIDGLTWDDIREK